MPRMSAAVANRSVWQSVWSLRPPAFIALDIAWEQLELSCDALSREFARAHSERLWKQLVMAPDAEGPANTGRGEILAVLCLAVAAALAVKVPALFGLRLSPDDEVPPFYFRNASLFVFPLLAIPFFILAGFVMDRVGLSRGLVNLLSLVIGPIRGGLGLVAVAGCATHEGKRGSGAPAPALFGRRFLRSRVWVRRHLSGRR